MTARLWFEDTIARRFAMALTFAVVAAVGISVVVTGGVWSRPSAQEMGLASRIGDIESILDAARKSERATLAKSVRNDAFTVAWFDAASSEAADLKRTHAPRTDMDFDRSRGFSQARRRIIFTAETQDPELQRFVRKHDSGPDAYYLATALSDGSLMMVTVPHRFWGLAPAPRYGIRLLLVIASIAFVSLVSSYAMLRPIRQFTEAFRRFGHDPRAAPLTEVGPKELRGARAAFNAMQAQIQALLEGRTAVFAAISHDLRTPLTKMRLRGEFIDDPVQRSRLFRDVDDMQAMLNSALAFLKDDYEDEQSTLFDFPELLRTIADDYGDHGAHVSYSGPDKAGFRGRPFALKRAFTNLVDNGVKYGAPPAIELRCGANEVVVTVRDCGPGIPPELMERVFRPFYRLERSRNRATGGVGLGLTSARAVIAAHGGTIALDNPAGGGLEVTVRLPTCINAIAASGTLAPSTPAVCRDATSNNTGKTAAP